MKIALLLLIALHPFHVGLTDVVYNQKTETYQISLKLFTDDLEKGIEEFSNTTVDLTNTRLSQESDSLIRNYVDRYFSLSSQSKIDLIYIGSEKEYDVTWIYLESNQRDLEDVEIRNELLMDVYSDQTHVIHFTVGNSIESDLISIDKTSVQFK